MQTALCTAPDMVHELPRDTENENKQKNIRIFYYLHEEVHTDTKLFNSAFQLYI